MLLSLLTVLCYAVGYPLALIGHSPLGWVFVALGGPLLIATGVIVIRRLHLSIDDAAGRSNARSPAPELP